MNSNTKAGCESCSRLIKKILVRRKPIVVIHFVRFEQTLHLVWVLLSWWQQPLGKTWVLQCQNGAMTHISRKTKSSRQHALFLWPVKLMLWISNLFFHLIEITHFKNILMAYLQTCRSWGKIYSHVKNNFVYTLLRYPFHILFCLNKQIKEIFVETDFF